MAKRHQSTRRRTYGRRQHELHEREHRHDEWRPMTELPGAPWDVDAAPFSLAGFDLGGSRLRFAMGE